MAKTLYLVRHAKSDWTTGEADFDRPLNKRGYRDAPRMGQRLKDREAIPGIIVCSPARRAKETMELLNLGAGQLTFDDNIYEGGISDLLEIVRSLDDTYESAMLIGHNPGMSWFASQLTGERIDNMPTCAIVTVRIRSKHWKKALSADAELLDLDYPKRT
jgi:phosphohistidine phosphatase